MMPNRHDPPLLSHGDADIDDFSRRLLRLDALLSQQTTTTDDQSTLRQPIGAYQVDARDSKGVDTSQPEVWLPQIERIRRIAPQLLQDAFGVAPTPTGADDSKLADPPPLATPETLGRFRLIRRLGQGGYGVVFLVEDPQLRRHVALKLPRPEVLVTADLERRFLREAEAAAGLDHPHIVPVYEAGRIGPICYIASAYVEGRSLSEWLAGRSEPIRERLAAEIIEVLAGAVDHAHRRGVLHRDIKPSNVLLAGVDGTEESGRSLASAAKETNAKFTDGIRLTDFGLARMIERGAFETQSTEIVGTPAYMSPEQAGQRHGDIGTASDIYSLGATFYHLLTGAPPHVGETIWQTIVAIQNEQPAVPHQLRPGVSRDLEAICLKCLEKEPGKRYSTAFELQQDLLRYLNGDAVLARHTTPFRRGLLWCRRNSLLASLGALATFGLLAAMNTSLVGWWLTSAALHREQEALTIAERRHEEMKDAIEKYFITISEDRLLTAPGLKPLRQELLRNALEYYAKIINRETPDAEVTDELRKAHIRKATIEMELGDIPAARTGFESALRLVDAQLEDNPHNAEAKVRKGMILRKLASIDRLTGDVPAAMQRLDEAISLYRSLLAQGVHQEECQGQVGQLLSNRANVLLNQGDLLTALELHGESEDCFRDLCESQSDDPQWRYFVAQSMGNQAIIHLRLNDGDSAQDLLLKAIATLRKLVVAHPEHLEYQMDLGKGLANLSTCYTSAGDTESALSSLQDATIAFDRLAMIHPQVVIYDALRSSTRRETAAMLISAGEFSEAEVLLLESQSILDRLLRMGGEHTGFLREAALTQFELGMLYRQLDQLPQASDHLQKAVTELTRLYQRDSADATAALLLAKALHHCAVVIDQRDTAWEYLRRSQEILSTFTSGTSGDEEIGELFRLNEQLMDQTGVEVAD